MLLRVRAGDLPPAPELARAAGRLSTTQRTCLLTSERGQLLERRLAKWDTQLKAGARSGIRDLNLAAALGGQKPLDQVRPKPLPARRLNRWPVVLRPPQL